MPLASALCPISGFSVVVMPGSPLVAFVWVSPAVASQVVAEDEIRHAAGLVLTLDVVGQPVDDLGTPARSTLDRLDVGDQHVHADPTADAQRCRKADLVEPVVEDHGEALDGADLPEQTRGQTEGQEAVL